MPTEVEHGVLRRAALQSDPFAQFALWFGEVCASGLPDPNAMSLATAAADGRPTLRTVLLKSYDARGFVFFTNLESRKARQIQENPRVSLLFPWLALRRQVRVTGAAERVTTSEALSYFVTRPRGSQLGAWVSQQSSVVSLARLLEMKWEEMKRKFAGGEVPLPSWWGGYRVAPCEIEFWQIGAGLLDDRFVYNRSPSGEWALQRLAP